MIGYLLSACADGPQGDGAPRQVILSAGKSVIASRLNMTPEHFSRVLHDLTAAGLIMVEGKSVQIPDLGGLREHRA